MSNRTDVTSVLLIGAGYRGLHTYVPGLIRRGITDLTVVDTPQRNNDVVLRLPKATRVYDSLDEALARRRYSMAIVATPHATHLAIGLHLLEHRQAFLLEKPHVVSAREAKALLSATIGSRTHVLFARPLSHDLRYAELRRVLLSGRCKEATLRITASVAANAGFENWRADPTLSGGGVVLDLGYHYLDFLVGVLGQPHAVALRAVQFRCTGRQVESKAVATLWFEQQQLLVELYLDATHSAVRERRADLRPGGSTRWVPLVEETSVAYDSAGVKRSQLVLNDALQASQRVWSARKANAEGKRLSAVLRLIERLYAADAARSKVVASGAI